MLAQRGITRGAVDLKLQHARVQAEPCIHLIASCCRQDDQRILQYALSSEGAACTCATVFNGCVPGSQNWVCVTLTAVLDMQ
jgi:hypothetical protein